MFSYRKIVFGMKQKFRVDDVLKFLKQQRYCSFLISEHDAVHVDNFCERPDVHYHGVVEFNDGGSKNETFLMQLSHYCIYMNFDSCNNPAEYLAYIIMEPKRIIAREILESSNLVEHLVTASNMKLHILKKKEARKVSLCERNKNIIHLVDFLLKFGYYGSTVLSKYMKSESRLPWFQRWIDENKEIVPSITQKNIEIAMNISHKIVLNSSILDLSKRFDLNDEYLSPEESVHYVLDWCSHQNMDPKAFTKNLIRCLEKRGGNRNSIYFQGSANSGKTYIIQSIIDACIHVGQVTVESTSYDFVWEKCGDKRLIVLREPHFSMINFEQLDKILSGSGTLIYKHNDVMDYLTPTPVIILANENEWMEDPYLSEKIKKRCLCCYMDLKYYPKMNEKKLHPQWLHLLNKKFSCKNGSKVDQSSDMKASSHLAKTGADDNLLTKSLMNTKQDSENTILPNINNRKRPKSCIEKGGARNETEYNAADTRRTGKVLKMSHNQNPNFGNVPMKGL